MTQLIWQECFYDRQLSLYESYLGSSLHRRDLYIVAEIWQNTEKGLVYAMRSKWFTPASHYGILVRMCHRDWHLATRHISILPIQVGG